jgi:hypothetical protein
MDVENHENPLSIRLWQSKKTITADKDLELILGSVKNLPITYWRPNYFFFGGKDIELKRLTDGAFPAKPVSGKSHPVFALRPLPQNVGFKVCPCSSQKPYAASAYRFIARNCRLEPTGYQMDRNSYLVETVELNIPRAFAYELRFRGRVPDSCLKHGSKKKAK